VHAPGGRTQTVELRAGDQATAVASSTRTRDTRVVLVIVGGGVVAAGARGSRQRHSFATSAGVARHQHRPLPDHEALRRSREAQSVVAPVERVPTIVHVAPPSVVRCSDGLPAITAVCAFGDSTGPKTGAGLRTNVVPPLRENHTVGVMCE